MRGDEMRVERGTRTKGTRLPADFSPDRDWTVKTLSDLDIDGELERFRDYWNGQTGQKATKVDWPGTWRNWIRRCKESGRYARKAPEPSSPGPVSLDKISWR